MPGDIQDPERLIAKLRDTDDPISHHIRGMLLTETQQLVGNYENLSSVSMSLKTAIQKDLQRILLRGKLLFDERIIEHLNISEEISGMIEKNPTGNDLVRLNRLLLAQAFPNEIAAKHPPIFIVSTELIKFIIFELREEGLSIIMLFSVGLSVFLLLIIATAYFIAFASVQVRFSDVRHVDEMLEYFVVQMGFKPPTKDKGNLVFKPTRSKFIRDIILVGFPTKLMARIEGNSVVITGTIPTVRGLTKQMNAFSN